MLAEPVPGARLIAPDLPGFGASYANGAFRPSIPSYARNLGDFLDDLAVDRALLLGHSFGAAVATELALSDPDRFPALFLLAPAPHTGLYTPEYLYPSWRATATTAAASARRSGRPSAGASPVLRGARGRGGPDAPGQLLRQRPPPLGLERGREALPLREPRPRRLRGARQPRLHALRGSLRPRLPHGRLRQPRPHRTQPADRSPEPRPRPPLATPARRQRLGTAGSCVSRTARSLARSPPVPRRDIRQRTRTSNTKRERRRGCETRAASPGAIGRSRPAMSSGSRSPSSRGRRRRRSSRR
ncbi:alpha/beta hydrolase [Rubrobacter marinus]|uniref:alpha/beta hydrolase n=1 Tax=Rubrobacter marinus TaxID=2653852 RepID=UPI00389A9BEB